MPEDRNVQQNQQTDSTTTVHKRTMVSDSKKVVQDDQVQDKILKNFTACFDSYLAGILLLIRHLPKNDWKLLQCIQGIQGIQTEQTLVKIRAQHVHAECCRRLKSLHKKRMLTFEKANQCMEDLLGGFQYILVQKTCLVEPFLDIIHAQRFAVWDSGRQDLMIPVSLQHESTAKKNTGLSSSLNEKISLNQCETPIVDEELLRQEYAKIGHTDKEPIWFKMLPKWQQNFISNNQNKLPNLSSPATLRNIFGLHNMSLHSLRSLDGEEKTHVRFRCIRSTAAAWRIEKGGLDRKQGGAAACEFELQQLQDEQFRLTCLNILSQIRLTIEQLKLEQLKLEQLELARLVAEKLSLTEATEATEAIKAARPKEAIVLIQSLLSPGSLSTWRTQLFPKTREGDTQDSDTEMYETKERVITFLQRVLQYPTESIENPEIKRIFFRENEGTSSALSYADLLKPYGFIYSAQQNGWSYKESFVGTITLISTNHALNALRRLGPYAGQVTNNDRNTILLLNSVIRHLTQDLKRIELQGNTLQKKWYENIYKWPSRDYFIMQIQEQKDVQILFNNFLNKLKAYIQERSIANKDREKDRKCVIESLECLLTHPAARDICGKKVFHLLDALQSYLSTNYQSFLDSRHAESFASASEVILVNALGGLACVSCKSGKDRTALALSAVDAAFAYQQMQHDGRLPRYTDEEGDRQRHVSCWKSFLESGHHQKVAALNSPGAEGLVKPPIPDDMLRDSNKVSVENQFAHLHRPPKCNVKRDKSFNDSVYRSRLQEHLSSLALDVVNKVKHNGQTTTDWGQVCLDWSRIQESCRINDSNVCELVRDVENRDRFQDQDIDQDQDIEQLKKDQLERFLKQHILSIICQDGASSIKEKCWKYLCIRQLHHGNLLYPSGFLESTLLGPYYDSISEAGGALPSKALCSLDHQVHFLPSPGQLRIREVNHYTYVWKDDQKRKRIRPGEYHCLTDTVIAVTIHTDNGGQHRLKIKLEHADVHCPDEQVRPFFEQKRNISILEQFGQIIKQLWYSLLILLGWNHEKSVNEDEEGVVFDIQDIQDISESDSGSSSTVSTVSTQSLVQSKKVAPYNPTVVDVPSLIERKLCSMMCLFLQKLCIADQIANQNVRPVFFPGVINGMGLFKKNKQVSNEDACSLAVSQSSALLRACNMTPGCKSKS